MERGFSKKNGALRLLVDKVKRSILIDSGADIISYGMGEHSIVEIADALNAGIDVSE